MDETETKSMISRVPIYTICVIALCIVSSKIDALAALFVYDIEAIFKGEIWRLITSHFVHFGAMHLIYNTVAFGITGWIIEYKGYGYFKLLCLLMACSISITLIVFKPDMIYFGGLSGVACGSIIYCSLLCLREPSPWPTASILTIIFLFVKISLEIYNNGSLLPYGGTQGFVPVPLSHIVGSITAFFLFFLTQKNVLMQNELPCETNQLEHIT
ncbi:MAG: rhombosortase [Desulfobacterales bacterium]|nr:MAG: rhombosortase [Desulfobacterales bacterium]